jgi:proline iminopeptidase
VALHHKGVALKGRRRRLLGCDPRLCLRERHPERVTGMVLAAVTSGRRRETQWITRDMGRVFLREWDRFVELVPDAERGGDLAAAYARLLASPDQALRKGADRRWCAWEDTHMSLAPDYTPHLSVQGWAGSLSSPGW